jgi:hypothetical protein
MNPRARKEELLVETVADELTVYDPESHRVHHLNRTAALVWEQCNGERTVAEITASLQTELDPVVDEHLVQHTLDRLAGARLLEGWAARTAEEARTSRRQFVRKVGLVGALSLLLPAVTSIVAPTPAQAQSGSGCEPPPPGCGTCTSCTNCTTPTTCN